MHCRPILLKKKPKEALPAVSLGGRVRKQTQHFAPPVLVPSPKKGKKKPGKSSKKGGKSTKGKKCKKGPPKKKRKKRRQRAPEDLRTMP
jgi:hypothetical protein